MKLKAIASLFNRNKRLVIFNAPDGGGQWIGNGMAAYSLSGMPHMTPDIVLRIFDVPPDRYSKWLCEETELPTAIDFSNNDPEESDIEPLKVNIEWFGDNYWLFPDGRRIYSFNEDYIKPLLDEPDYLTYHKRQTAGGGFVLACKVGLELRAIIAPFLLEKQDDFTEEIQRIADLYAEMERAAEQERVVSAAYELFKAAAAQVTTPTDPDKGDSTNGQISLDE